MRLSWSHSRLVAVGNNMHRTFATILSTSISSSSLCHQHAQKSFIWGRSSAQQRLLLFSIIIVLIFELEHPAWWENAYKKLSEQTMLLKQGVIYTIQGHDRGASHFLLEGDSCLQPLGMNLLIELLASTGGGFWNLNSLGLAHS